MGCSWFNTETNKKKTSINNKNMHQIRRLKISSYETKSPAKNLQISSCSIATLSHLCNYKVQFCAFKGDATHKISPLEELVGGRSPPQQFPEVKRYGINFFSEQFFEYTMVYVSFIPYYICYLRKWLKYINLEAYCICFSIAE